MQGQEMLLYLNRPCLHSTVVSIHCPVFLSSLPFVVLLVLRVMSSDPVSHDIIAHYPCTLPRCTRKPSALWDHQPPVKAAHASNLLYHIRALMMLGGDVLQAARILPESPSPTRNTKSKRS